MPIHCKEGYRVRPVLCVLISVTLLLTCIWTSPARPAAPAADDAGAQSAWWGLLCPGLFGDTRDGQRVVFVFPWLEWLGNALFGSA